MQTSELGNKAILCKTKVYKSAARNLNFLTVLFARFCELFKKHTHTTKNQQTKTQIKTFYFLNTNECLYRQLIKNLLLNIYRRLIIAPQCDMRKSCDPLSHLPAIPKLCPTPADSSVNLLKSL